MKPEEVKARARTKARAAEAGLGEVDEEALRTEVLRFFAKLPEPPVYRRRDDPARAAASGLLAEGEELLARAYRLQGAAMATWQTALEQHVETLCLIAEGRVEAADDAWHRAIAVEAEATASRRLWSRTDDVERPVFRRETGESRYDPRPEAAVQVKLPCPACRKVGDFSFSPRHATHRFRCSSCRAEFTAYFGELRQLERERLGRGHRYRFRVEELSGVPTRIDLDDGGIHELLAARRDLLAFLYLPPTVPRGVLNLNSSRVLWLTRAGACFVATVAFGEGAEELEVLRAVRDGVLSRSTAGRAFIGWYYAKGPALAAWLSRRPGQRAVARQVLRAAVWAAKRVEHG